MSKNEEPKKIEILKVVLKIGKEELSLTIDEAKRLKAELNKIFADSKTEYIPMYPRSWNPFQQYGVGSICDPLASLPNQSLVQALVKGNWADV